MKQNGVVCQPGFALSFFVFRFEYLISGLKSYRDFRSWSFYAPDTSLCQKLLAMRGGIKGKLKRTCRPLRVPYSLVS